MRVLVQRCSRAKVIVDNKIVAYDLEDALKQKREFDMDKYRLIELLGK